MQFDWPVLKSPPVILAVFQLKFTQAEDGALSRMIANEKKIKLMFPKRSVNYHSDINVLETPVPGITTFKGKANTKIDSYTFFTLDEKRKFRIEKDSIVITNENFYEGWESFKSDVMDCLNLLSDQLVDCSVFRTSIRFINKFTLESFDDPLEYFTKMISTESDIVYPLVKFAFRFNVQVPDSDIIAIVNNALEPNDLNKFDYYLDIDVLDQKQMKFDLLLTSDQMEKIREVKNTIFFDIVKQKTLDLCN